MTLHIRDVFTRMRPYLPFIAGNCGNCCHSFCADRLIDLLPALVALVVGFAGVGD